MRLAIEEKRKPDTSLPDPSDLGFSASETEMLYELWSIWKALGRPPNISILIDELVRGHGGVIAGLLQMDTLYAKTQQQLEDQNPKK